MSIRYAFVTLLTSDAYLPGALTIAAALKDVHRPLPSDQTAEYEVVCLVTPETVDVTSIKLLRKAFDLVVGVETIVPPDTGSLTLLGRPDLDTALTKLHAFRLTQYTKVLFLDADALPLRPLSHLFHLDHDFSAVPDVGWPDIFNSGVMVFSPGEDKFKQLQELLDTKGTWDGADQGLLNEWRGNEWNRLSFTYNTTPTAIYTYAPAYRRFGSQISVVHFIGPHKPWYSIASRAPGSSAQSAEMTTDLATETSPSSSRTYDYGSLVDRWYNVYDRHYRSQSTEPAFQPAKYISAWNEGGPRQAAASSGVLGLEELRRIALEGMGASGILTSRAHGEGEYRTMPLEGRFDLIRPRTRAERMEAEATEDRAEAPEPTPAPVEPSTPEPSTPVGQALSVPPGSPIRWTTLPTPGINEIPPAPHARLMSLPPTPLRYVLSPHGPLRTSQEAGAQTVMEHVEAGRARSYSTPLMAHKSAETPPRVTPAPPDAYFSKAWEMDRNWSSVSPSSSETSLTTMELSPPSKPQGTRDMSLSPTLVPVTPEKPRSQGQYHGLAGEEDKSPTPDLVRVRRVFPWEERPRHVPRRVFPDEGASAAPIRRAAVSGTPERRFAIRSPMPSPLAGLPLPSFQPHYRTDGRIQQGHAGKVAWLVTTSSPLGPEGKLGRVETGSQDGDIEDEVDSEEETLMRRRGARIEMGKRARQYRSIGVQTDPTELHEEGIQATAFIPEAEEAERHGLSTPDGTTPTVVTTTDDAHLSNWMSLTTAVLNETDEKSPSSAPPPPADSHLVRRGARVWDPARGVENFKRGSEEVLAKFMKVGAWNGRT